MTAWERLLAASSYVAGTAWELLTHPKTGSGVVVNDGIAVSLVADPFVVAVAAPLVAEVFSAPVVAELAATEVVVQVQDQVNTSHVAPSIQVEIPE